MTQAGQARASGYLGQANALSNALGQAAMGYGMYKGGYFGSPGGSAGTGYVPRGSLTVINPYVPTTTPVTLPAPPGF